MDIEQRIDDFIAVVRAGISGVTADPTADGFAAMTAACLLMRGIELLEAARASPADAAAPARELVLRSVVEVALRGEFLLGPEGADELGRMLGSYLDKGPKQAARLSGTFGGVAQQFIDAVAVPLSKTSKGSREAQPTRDLATIARQLDRRAGLLPTDDGSAVRAYETFYAPLSDAAAHGSLAAIRRYTRMEDGRLCIDAGAPPLTTPGRQVWVIAAGLLGDLAHLVFLALGLDTGGLLATGVRMKH